MDSMKRKVIRKRRKYKGIEDIYTDSLWKRELIRKMLKALSLKS